MKEIFIEIIKVSKIPLIIYTIYLLIPFNLANFENFINKSNIKQIAIQDFRIEFFEKKFKQTISEIKKIDSNTSSLIIKEFDSIIQNLQYISKANNKLFGEVKTTKQNLIKIFGTNNIEKNKKYTILKDTIVIESDGKTCIANPKKNVLEANTSVKILDIFTDKDNINLYIEIEQNKINQ